MRDTKAAAAVASSGSLCWWVCRGAKSLSACGSLWDVLQRKLLPTGLLLSRLREHKSSALPQSSLAQHNFGIGPMDPTSGICGQECSLQYRR